MGSSPDQVKSKTLKLVFVASPKHTALRSKHKDWLARDQDNVSTLGRLLHYKYSIKRVVLVQRKFNIIA